MDQEAQLSPCNESEVRYYCRRFPHILVSGSGAVLRDANDKEFIDFLSACGALNFGHNHAALKEVAIQYLLSNGLVAGLDLHIESKVAFIEAFTAEILQPRGLKHKLQFPGPTGANCVEAAVKLARKVTKRTAVVAFTNAFHGMSIGALALSGSRFARSASAPLLNGVLRLPFDGYCGAGIRDLERFCQMATDPSGGIDPIAAFVVETVQGEGGLNVANVEWLQTLSVLASKLGALLIVDEIQAGCGRTGTYFSFERAGIVPDVICLAKSISGLGLPMSLLLLRPEIDIWSPGEHNGTFRGNGLAFATATQAIHLWKSSQEIMQENCTILSEWCEKIAADFPGLLRVKGLGMLRGLEFRDATSADEVARRAVAYGILIECCGPRDEVLKIMAPLNIDRGLFREGLRRLAECCRETLCTQNRAGLYCGTSQRYETLLDPDDDGRDPIRGPELSHGVA
jgi:diaminobutyrate-2-oxoglutarate transaminase